MRRACVPSARMFAPLLLCTRQARVFSSHSRFLRALGLESRLLTALRLQLDAVPAYLLPVSAVWIRNLDRSLRYGFNWKEEKTDFRILTAHRVTTSAGRGKKKLHLFHFLWLMFTAILVDFDEES
ncbi:hypothetical protein NDU88_003106 [Pleurodeles waltl]|uniref:Secreted protein n=1 Tax=Pleurodeles waltl TaxID=8319 RepID=A0AAV7TNR9_PLEWA|nr:hypothetical protein NDU88_003106 [Pleurodeles waltl]